MNTKKTTDSRLLLNLLTALCNEAEDTRKRAAMIKCNRVFLQARGAGRALSKEISSLSVQCYGHGFLSSLFVFQRARQLGLIAAPSSEAAIKEETRGQHRREFVIAGNSAFLQSRGAGAVIAQELAAVAFDHCGGDSKTAGLFLAQRGRAFSRLARFRSFQSQRRFALKSAPPADGSGVPVSCSVWWLGQNLAPRPKSLATVQDWMLKGAAAAGREWARANWAREARDLAEHADGCGDDVGAWQCHSQDCLAIFREVYLVELAKWQSTAKRGEIERAAVMLGKFGIIRHLSPSERDVFFQSFPSGFMKARGAAKRRGIKEAIAFRYAARGRDGREVAAGWAINGSTGTSSFKDSDGSTVKLDSSPGWDSVSGKRESVNLRRAAFVNRLRAIARTKEIASQVAGAGGRGLEAARNRHRLAAIIDGERMTDGERAAWTEGENQALSPKFRKQISRLKKEVAIVVRVPSPVVVARPVHRDFFEAANY